MQAHPLPFRWDYACFAKVGATAPSPDETILKEVVMLGGYQEPEWSSLLIIQG